MLGTHSFLDGGLKVGVQRMAEGFAERGWTVDYVSTSSSPFDLVGRSRRRRFKGVWLDGQDRRGVVVAPRLVEYRFKALLPVHRLFVRAPAQLHWFEYLLPRWIRNKTYSACLHETTPNVVFFDRARARVNVFRLSDLPEGFLHEMPDAVVNLFRRHLGMRGYDEVWSVSHSLSEYADRCGYDGPIVEMPNGIDGSFAGIEKMEQRRRRNSAVFVGGVSHPWVDIDLVERVAGLLPDWVFDLYGTGADGKRSTAPNVRFHSVVSRQAMPALLAGYEVGLIPFRDLHGRMDYVERPLKFYEYIAAGLGVVSTDVGGLREGMGGLSRFGQDPESFAAGVLAARDDGRSRGADFAKRFATEHSWESIIERASDRLERLVRDQAV